MIAARADVMAGVPCVDGTRIPVTSVVGMVADGMSWDEIVDAFPQLSHDAIREALQFAAARVDEQEIVLPDPA